MNKIYKYKKIYSVIILLIILTTIYTNVSYAVNNTPTASQSDATSATAASTSSQSTSASTNSKTSVSTTAQATATDTSTNSQSTSSNTNSKTSISATDADSTDTSSDTATSTNSQSLGEENTLNLYSQSSILIEASSGQILYEHNAYEKLYPASTTKLMTAILTLENCDLSETVTVEKEALSGIPTSYTTASLQAGETLTVEQLLNVLLIPSANDAANVLAYYIADSVDDFSEMMNSRAKELGCQNTHFVNPNGVHNDDHYSTAYDLALIGQYANTFDAIKQIAAKTEYSLPNLPDGTERKFKTTNTLITPTSKYYYEYATGLKTGYTDKAKSCIVASAEKNDMELICVVLHGDKTEDKQSQRELDCHTLFDYGFNNYEKTEICTENTIIDKTTLSDIPEICKNADLVYSDDLELYVNKNSDYNSSKEIIWVTDLSYPVYKNTIVGTLTYTIDGKNYSVNILAGDNIWPTSSDSASYIFYILLAILIIILLITIFNKKRKNRYHKKSKSSKDEKYFRHSFY